MAYIIIRNNGEERYETRDEYIKARRGIDKFESIEKMAEYFCKYGRGDENIRQRWIGFINPLGIFVPSRDAEDLLTNDEALQLLEYQSKLRKEYEEAEKARQWKLVNTVYWADNSVEKVYEDKDGNRKTVMTVGPHGDVC